MRVQPKMIGGKFNGYTSVKRLITDPQKISQLEQTYQALHSKKTILVNGQFTNARSYKIKSLLGITRFSLTLETAISLFGVLILILLAAFLQEIEQ